MITRKKAVPVHAVNKSRHVLSLSLVALLGAAALGAGPAFAADSVHCVHTIDYNKLSASELEMLYRDIDVPQVANAGAAKGKCVATIDYKKLSAEELAMQYRDIDVYSYVNHDATGTKYLAAIDYGSLSVEQLDRINKDINLVVVGDGAEKGKSMTALAVR